MWPFKKKVIKKPIRFKDGQFVFFDVDDTLVMWPIGGQPDFGREHEYIIINDEYGRILVRPHKRHVQAIKEHKARGHIVIVWSQGGSDWAERVVKALNLEPYVDLILNKPSWFYDDLPASIFMNDVSRFYKNDD